jgi:hypothetical protein
MFELFSDTQQLIAFDVYVDGAQAYDGVFMPVGSAPSFEANIALQDILKPFFAEPPALVTPDAIVSEMERMYIDFTVNFHADDAEILTHTARAYRGGISKELLRRLNEEGLDIFDYKLMNTQQQFFMTTRTNSTRITIREDELTPLCFIATGKTHRVTTDTGETYTFPPTEPGKVYAFNIEAFITSLSEPPHQLSIPLFLNQSITIDIIPATRVPNRFALEFANSYGLPERLEVTGLASYEPEVSDDSYSVYLFNVDDYAERNDRQSLREIIKAQTGYKTPDEYMFLRDLLQSERVYLIDDDGRREVRVKAEDLSHALRPVEPESVELTIRFVDSDARFSPAFYENPVLNNLFIATLNLPTAAMTVALPFKGNVDLMVNWGDGTEQTITGDYPTHQYQTAGVYTINVVGHADMMELVLSQSYPPASIVNWKNRLIAIEQWGDLGLRSLNYACAECVNLSQVERNVKFANVTSAEAMFYKCSSLTYTFTQLDAPLLTDADRMYSLCSSLEDVSEYLFAGCPALQSVNELFYNCSSLVNIPVSLFANNTDLKSVQISFSYCTHLQNAPSFYYNRKVESFYYTFSYCYDLQEVPDYCFYKSRATDFSYTFYQCTSLTAVPEHIFAEAAEALLFSGTFRSCKLTEISANLFRDCVNVTSFAIVLSDNNLTALPADLFRYNTLVTSFQSALSDNNLTALPADLFRYNTLVTSFEYTLSDNNLTALSADLFRYNTLVTSFAYVLSNNNLTALPADLFRYNTLVTSFVYALSSNNLTALPADLFRYNIDVLDFSNVFSDNEILESIPASLFMYNTKVTVFNRAFSGCTSLTTIPAALFQYHPDATGFTGTFSRCGLTAIPPNLFTAIKNNASTNLESCFSATNITSIPEELLKPLTEITQLNYVFEYCSALLSILPTQFMYNTKVTSFSNTFLGCTSVTAIPAALFQYHPDAIYFYGTFSGCSLTAIPPNLFTAIKNSASTNVGHCFSSTNITSIPEELLKPLTQITQIESTFRYCNALTTIPPDLFKYNVNLISMADTFASCSALTSIPESLFSWCPQLTYAMNVFSNSNLTAIPNLIFDNNKNLINLSGCFAKNVGLTGSTPSGSDGVKLWQRAGKPGYPASVGGRSCFYGDTLLDDYSSMPSDWYARND